MLPFKYVDRLGAGMSAVVDIVEDKTTGREFAHKAFRPYYGPDLQKFKVAFQNEIDIIKRLHSHPHIIQIHWSYACGNELGMLLTPVARDGDLRAYLRRLRDTEGLPTPEQSSVLARSFGCLASGLAFIHRHTIRHKDIKPQNILVANGGKMVYADFGIAFDASDEDTTTTGIPEAFTNRYCAPEVADWEPRNRKSDIFSLGCVFLEIMAFLPPDVDLGTSNPSPYWRRVDELQDTLTSQEANNTVSSWLFVVFRDMLKPIPADRIDADALVRCIWSINDSSLGPAYRLFCTDCENMNREDKHPVISTLTSSTQADILALLKKRLIKTETPTMYMYIFTLVEHPDLVKIGTASDVPSLLEVARKLHLLTYVNYEQNGTDRGLLLKNALRVEQLVFTELQHFRHEKRVEGHKRFGLFRTTAEHAAKVIRKYADWMEKDPYQFDKTSNLWTLDENAWRDDIDRLCQPIPFDSSQVDRSATRGGPLTLMYGVGQDSVLREEEH
jgi:serine/threonine protein kinase